MGFKIKKTVNGETVWEPIKAKKYTASKINEYSGALPITINTDGNALLDYRIYGNTEQTGTPTPENPIMPIGCGEMLDITGLSEPLCGIETYTDSLDLSTGILTRRIKKLVLTGKEKYFRFSDNTYGITDYYFYLPTDVQTAICTHLKKQTTSISQTTDEGYLIESMGGQLSMFHMRISYYSTEDKLKEYLALLYDRGEPVTIWYVLTEPEVSTIPVPPGPTGVIEGYLIQDGTPTFHERIYPTANGVKQADDTYSIPYCKLPILSNSTVTNIYLGEVETTRRIYKTRLVNPTSVTKVDNGYRVTFSISSHPAPSYMSGGGVCNIAKWDGNYDNVGFVVSLTHVYITQNMIEWSRKEAATLWFNEHEVYVWYVLAEPETGIVNEPLMKIGDHADTVNMEQAGVSIPTNKGTTVIDYDGTLKPSQMYTKYNSQSRWEDIDNYKMSNENWTQEVTE